MPQPAAIISFCTDLTSPDAKAVPLFKVTVDPGAKLRVSYLQTYKEMTEYVGKDNFTLGIVQMYPWHLASFLQEVGEDKFLFRLAEETQHSSIFVERIEPC